MVALTLKLFESHDWVNPVQIAGELQTNVESVRNWIREGHLKAINTSSIGAKKPRWKISEPIWLAFAESRLATPQSKPTRRKRQDVDLSEFFDESEF